MYSLESGSSHPVLSLSHSSLLLCVLGPSHCCAVLHCVNTQQCTLFAAGGHGGRVLLGAAMRCVAAHVALGHVFGERACVSAGRVCGSGARGSRPCRLPRWPGWCTLLPLLMGVTVARHPPLDVVKSFKCPLSWRFLNLHFPEDERGC